MSLGKYHDIISNSAMSESLHILSISLQCHAVIRLYEVLVIDSVIQ